MARKRDEINLVAALLALLSRINSRMVARSGIVHARLKASAYLDPAVAHTNGVATDQEPYWMTPLNNPWHPFCRRRFTGEHS